MIALLKKNENLRILNFVKSPKIGNPRKFKHAKISRSTVLANLFSIISQKKIVFVIPVYSVMFYLKTV